MPVQTRKIFGLCLILVVFALAGGNGVLAEDGKNLEIVTVDINRIMVQHPSLVEAQETLQREAQQMQRQAGKSGQADQQKIRQRLQERSQELQLDALAEVRNEIEKIAAEKGYTYVMEKNALLAGGRDVTDEFMEAMKKMDRED